MLIELAGIPAEVICRHPENEEFLRDYATDREPLFSVAPSDADLKRMQEDYDRRNAVQGLPKGRRRREQLENSAVHSLLAEKLTEYGVLLMHGSALCMDGQAYVFTAKSGTGKSTHARLWREAFGRRVWMINDDKPLLRIGEDGVTVFGSPWSGKHRLGRNAGAGLKAIVCLRRGAENRIEPVSGAEAFPTVLSQCFRSSDPACEARILRLEKRLLERAEFYRLECNMRPEAALVAWEGMNGRR